MLAPLLLIVTKAAFINIGTLRQISFDIVQDGFYK